MYSPVESDWPRWDREGEGLEAVPMSLAQAPEADSFFQGLAGSFWPGHEQYTAPAWAPDFDHAPLVLDVDGGEDFSGPSGEGVHVLTQWEAAQSVGPAEVLFLVPNSSEDRPFIPSPLPEPPIDTPPAWADLPMEWSGLDMDTLNLDGLVDFGALALTT
jgi:hypothetical protein